jgi:nitrogen fixation protein NifQ
MSMDTGAQQIIADDGPHRPEPCNRAPSPHVDCAVLYEALTGTAPAFAETVDDDDFDRHVFASILAVAASEGGPLADLAGLPAADLDGLLRCHFPASAWRLPRAPRATPSPSTAGDHDEIGMLHALLSTKRSTEGETGRWLAAMVARRAMEPNHLWEDLRLRDRSELPRLLMRHFAPLASRNSRNMRWKRFFYRSMCEDDGFVMCTTPVCTHCADFDLCFGEETGESRMAEARRLNSTDPTRALGAGP